MVTTKKCPARMPGKGKIAMQGMAQQEARRNSEGAKFNGPVIVAEWPLNRRERLRVSLEKFKGARLISIRKWFEADDGGWRPTNRGISVSLRHLLKLAASLDDALAIARERGLIEAGQPPSVGEFGDASHETSRAVEV
jgi:hypothetical protein